MTVWNTYVVGDGSHPASFAAAKGVAANIPTNADLIAYVGDIYPQGHRYYIEVGTVPQPNKGFDFIYGERTSPAHNLVPKMAMVPGNHEYEDAPEPAGPGQLPSPLAGQHSGDLSTLIPVGHEAFWTRPASTYVLKADGTVGAGADYKSLNDNRYQNGGSMTPVNQTAFNGGTTPGTYNGVTQGRHDFYFDLGGVRHVFVDDSQFTGAISAGAGGGGGDESFMPTPTGTAAQIARWNKLTGWVDSAAGNACIVYAHRTRWPAGNANGNHKPVAALGPFMAFCAGKIIAWIHGHWHNAYASYPLAVGGNPGVLSTNPLATNPHAAKFTGAGTTGDPRIITSNDGYPIFGQGNGGNSLNGFDQASLALGELPTVLREGGDSAGTLNWGQKYGYMKISYDDAVSPRVVTFTQYDCGTTGTLATPIVIYAKSYKTTGAVTNPTPQPPSFTVTPPSSDSDTTPTFNWQANDGLTVSFGYKVDGAAAYTTTTNTTVTLGALSLGAHTFKLSAFASDGVTHSSDITYAWTIASGVTSAPTTFACSVGATGSSTTSTSATFSWVSGGADDVAYDYQLDGSGTWIPNGAALSVTLSGIATGTHSFQVRARNASNTPSAAVPATPYSWSVTPVVSGTAQALFGQSHATGSPPAFDRTMFTNAEVAFGRDLILAHTLYNWGDSVPTVSTSNEKWMLDQGAIPIINCLGRLLPSAVGQNFPNFTNPGTVNDTAMIAIANGTYDTILKAWATFCNAFASDVFVRPWREMTNGAGACVWTTSTGTLFANAWKRMYTIFAATDDYADYNANVNPAHTISGTSIATGVAHIIWCPAIWANVYNNWYPGDAYVDWVGGDGYSYDTAATATNSNGPQGGWHTPHDIFINWYNQFNSQNGTIAKKPLIVCETNAALSTNSAHDRAAWWRQWDTSTNTDFPLIQGVCVWVDSTFPDFGVTGSSDYIAFGNDPVNSLAVMPGTGSPPDTVTLTVTNPPSDITVTSSAYVLDGTATGGAGLALKINGVTETIDAGTDQSFTDTFGRSVAAGGFGNSWVADAGAAQQSVNGSVGQFTTVAANGTSRAIRNMSISDADIHYSHTLSANPVGGAYQNHLLWRRKDANNSMHTMVYQDATALTPIKVSLTKVVGGVTTTLATAVAEATGPAPTTAIWTRTKYLNNRYQIKAWSGLTSDEPGGAGSDASWLIDFTDTQPNAILGLGDVGISVFRATAESVAITSNIDNWALTDISAGVGGTGSFSVPVTLNPGANNYQFVLTDTSGAVQTISRTITYDNGSVVGTLPATDDGTVHKSISAQVYTPGTSTVTTTQDWQTIADTIDIWNQNLLPDRLFPNADDIVARNPAIWLGVYNKGTGIPTAAPNNLPEAWYAHSVATSSPQWGSTTRMHLAGSTAHWQAQPDGVGNWTDTTNYLGGGSSTVYHNWQEFHAQEVKNSLTLANSRYPTPSFGGIFLDSLGVGNITTQVDPSSGQAYSANHAAWYALVNQMVAFVRSYDPPALIITNGGDTNTGLGAVSEVTMNEGFLLGAATNAPSKRPTPGGFESDVQNAMDQQHAGCAQILLTYTWDAAGQTAWANATQSMYDEMAQLILGGYHLANQGSCFFDWSTQPANSGAVKPWNQNLTAYWNLNLGAPRDTQTTIAAYRTANNVGTNAGHVYRRRYQNGVVFVNTGNTPSAVTLDRSDYHEAGSATLLTSPYTVPAQGGAILVADTVPSGGILATPPAPTVSGTAQVGATLTTTNGTWIDNTGATITPSSFQYAWQSAADDGAGNALQPYTNIVGANSKTYVIDIAYLGKHIRPIVFGFDAAGDSATAIASNDSGIIISTTPDPPTPGPIPIITPSGSSPQVGDVLTSTPGTFNGVVVSQTIRWQRGTDTPSAWTDIGGATSTSYTTVSQDQGFQLRTVAKATNTGGSVEEQSDPTLVVTGAVVAPANVTVPTITGNAIVGETLMGDQGTWTGDNLVFDYQWQQR